MEIRSRQCVSSHGSPIGLSTITTPITRIVAITTNAIAAIATITPMPEEVTPEELGSAVHFRRLPATIPTRSTTTPPTLVRPISGEVIISTESTLRTSTYPSNPLRR